MRYSFCLRKKSEMFEELTVHLFLVPRSVGSPEGTILEFGPKTTLKNVSRILLGPYY